MSITTYETDSPDHDSPTPFSDLSRWQVGRLMDWLENGQENVVFGDGKAFYVSPDYEFTRKQVYSSQRKVATAWGKMQYPTHVVNRHGRAELVTSTRNFRGVQRPDGSGLLWHYRTLAGIRTKNGLVIANSQDFARGFAVVTRPPNSEASLPLTALQDILGGVEGLLEITAVRTDETLSRASHGTLIECSGGGGYVLFSDPTHHDHRTRCLMEVSEREIVEADYVRDLVELAKPEAVKVAEARGMKVVGSDTQPAGSDKPDDMIIRQGEWFFIPRPDFEPVGKVTKPQQGDDREPLSGRFNRGRPGDHSYMGAHIPRDATTGLLPECECGGSSFENDGPLWGCVACETPLYPKVRGTVKHRRNEHYVASLGETWHDAVTHDREVRVIDTSTGGRTGGFD